MSSIALKQTDLAFVLTRASESIHDVMRNGQSLDQALVNALEGVDHPAAKGAITDLSYYGLRRRGRGQALVSLLTGKPRLKPEHLEDFLALCFSLIWSEENSKYPAHTVVDQAVTACAANKKLQKAKGLVNACLRNFLRDRDKWVELSGRKLQSKWNFPKWWVLKVQNQHPGHWQALLEQANTHPPMVLRVNQRCMTGQDYLDQLKSQGLMATLMAPQTVMISEPVPVQHLPGFYEGVVSVQDSAAQLAANLLSPKDGDRVLDACAAPGGKTGHLLELADIDLLAIDSSEKRLRRVHENYDRLKPTLGQNHKLTVQVAGAEQIDLWWDGKPFDSIVADLPCSGSGVVRRHPDIRWLRREQDLKQLSQIQHKILNSLWPTLRPGGTLLLVTCSIFLEEGSQLLDAFLKTHADAESLGSPGAVLPIVSTEQSNAARRFDMSPDGFFYALISKTVQH